MVKRLNPRLLFALCLIPSTFAMAAELAPCPTLVCGSYTTWPVVYEIIPPLGETEVEGYKGTVVAGQVYRFRLMSGCENDFPAPFEMVSISSSWRGREGTMTEVDILVPADATEPATICSNGFGGEDCGQFRIGQPTRCINLLIEGQPTPTPSPIPPSPSPTWAPPTPCPPPCAPLIISPVLWSQHNPLTVVIEHAGTPGSFTGLSQFQGGPHPTTQIGPNQYLAENLNPGRLYIWSFTHSETCTNSEQWCTSYFSTIEPTPTPTPEPTPPPPTGDVIFISGAPVYRHDRLVVVR